MPRFSIILVHYQRATKHSEFCRGVASLFNQTYQDFEILAYHDGPLLDANVPLPIPLVCSDVRYDDWGHTLRDRGIREAKGEYIVHFNADNVLYPNALEEIHSAIIRPPRILTPKREVVDSNGIIIFPIVLRGYQRIFNDLVRIPGSPQFTVILTGNPPLVNYIDAMQFVMKRELWLAEGGWHDKSYGRDGRMYEQLARKYRYRCVEKILGEHF